MSPLGLSLPPSPNQSTDMPHPDSVQGAWTDTPSQEGHPCRTLAFLSLAWKPHLSLSVEDTVCPPPLFHFNNQKRFHLTIKGRHTRAVLLLFCLHLRQQQKMLSLLPETRGEGTESSQALGGELTRISK